MRPAPSLVGRLVTSPWFASAPRRRLIALTASAALALLALFPERYRAVVTMTPTDPASLGLSSTLGQLGATTSAFGTQAAIEISLKVSRSVDVRQNVIRRLNLVKRLDLDNEIAANRWLEREVDIRALRGGILQISTTLRDADLSLAIVNAYSLGIRDRLGQIARNQTAYKRAVLLKLIQDADKRRAASQAAYDNFRLQTRYSEPGGSIAAIGARIPALQAQLKAKEVELQTARSFATDDNMSVRQILVEMNSLRSQLQEASSLDANNPDSVNRVVVQSTEARNLQRDVSIAQNLYDSYRLSLRGTAVEDIASTGNVRIIESPFIDPDRQFNVSFAAFSGFILLLAIAAEFYMLRPPVGAFRSGKADA